MNLALVSRGRRMAADGTGQRVRLKAELSLSDIAQQIGVSAAAVYAWESGKAKPHGVRAVAYAELIGELEAELARN